MNDEGAALHVIVPGLCPPAPRPRARIMGSGNKTFAQIYTPKSGSYAEWKRAAVVYIMRARGPAGAYPILDDPIHVRLLFVIPLAESNHRKTRFVLREFCRMQTYGDVDNLAKGPLDAATGILWKDDSDVARLDVEKIVGEQGEPPRTEMLVSRLPREAATRTHFERVRADLRESGNLLSLETQESESWQPQQSQTSLPW